MACSSSSSPEISSADTQPRFSYRDASLEDVLDDLSSRFILNLPDEELVSLERLCFQVEQAHWFYEDFIREQNTTLQSLPLKRFSEMLFHACPILHQWSNTHEQAFKTFMEYKTRVPVCGAIMLNDSMDKCVLVKGWKSSSGWSFPKGKINQTEPPPTCAIREVLEETGYNLAGQLDPKNVIELSIKEQKISLFIVPSVPEDYPFKTQTRKEISKIEWFKLTDLPTWKRNKESSSRFYLISPFIAPLRAFLNQRKPRNNQRKAPKQRKPQPAASDVSFSSQQAARDHEPIREPSSQSSVGPQTPSLPRHNYVIATGPDVAEMDETSEMDPQLARLLSSLTLSATVRDELSNGTGVAVNQSGLSSAPTSDVSGDSPIVTHPPEQSDWSSSVPPDYLQPPDAPPPSKSSHNPSSAESSSSLAVSSTRASQPMVNGIASHTDQNPNNAIRTTTPSPPSAVSPTSQTSRRASSTADISPYLSRAAEVPTSAKRLQQLSLLESVANESERIAARHAAMVSQGPVASPYPPPSPSFPPPTIPDTGVFYSSTYPIPPSSAAGFHTRQPLGNFGPGHPDPFQVRSRTSQAFHRGPMHHPTGSVNMSHSHLLATINGPHVGPVSASYQMNSQFIHQQQQQPQIFNAGPQFYPPQLNPRYLPAQPARQRYATHPLEAQPIGGRPYPPPNPNPAPGLTMAPPDSHNPTAMSLLSILNGRPTQQPAVPAQVHQ